MAPNLDAVKGLGAIMGEQYESRYPALVVDTFAQVAWAGLSQYGAEPEEAMKLAAQLAAEKVEEADGRPEMRERLLGDEQLVGEVLEVHRSGAI